jgi:hypothetical protein
MHELCTCRLCAMHTVSWPVIVCAQLSGSIHLELPTALSLSCCSLLAAAGRAQQGCHLTRASADGRALRCRYSSLSYTPPV